MLDHDLDRCSCGVSVVTAFVENDKLPPLLIRRYLTGKYDVLPICTLTMSHDEQFHL